MSQIEEIKAFVMVVETGSLTQAADRLGIAVSAVSRRLKDLEIRLRAPLIQRTTRRMYLNEVGQGFYERCKIVLEELEAAQQEVLNSGGGIAGVLRISAPLSFGVTHMSSAIAQFMHAHPDVRIETDLSDKRVDLVAEGFDLAIRIGILSDSSLIAKKISTVRNIPCAAPDFLARYPAITKPEDLENAPALVYSNEKTPNDWRYIAPNGKPGVLRVAARLSASNGDVLREAAIAGLGFTCLPNFLHYDAINSGLLQPVLTDYEWLQYDVHVVYPKTTILPKRTRAFVDFMSTRYGKDPYWNKIQPQPNIAS
ncbi:MAG: LysR family transcriptional regulator [Bacteroidetes bacterium]|jgi:DNA-binding transcriptional LysR family regulator|nr:LysR family transcriptional regulator [Bacteroidota bacterium]